MRVLLVSHGLAPEHLGGTEASVQGLARALLRAGHDVLVVAGSDRWELGSDPREEVLELPEGRLRVLRLQRTDAYYDHWHKHRRARLTDQFEALLRAERPDVVHVHHWIRLSRDLVSTAAAVGIPALVTLHDLSSSCLLVHRVHPADRAPCDRPLAAEHCLPCAAAHQRPTPWVSAAQERTVLDDFTRTTAVELELAHAVIVLSNSQRELLEQHLPGLDASRWHVLPPFGQTAPLPRSLRPRPRSNCLRLGTWGSVSALKGLDLIVEAAALAARRVRIELEVAGAPESLPFLDACRTRAAAAGVALRYHGRFERDRLHLHPVATADVFISGTRARETWGVVLDEAIQLGMPMVLPRHGAYADRLTDGAGARFYAPLDPADLADVLVELARDPWALARLAEARELTAHALADTRHSLAQHLRLYAEAIEQGPPPSAPPTPAERATQRAAEQAWDQGLYDHGP